MNPSLQTKLDFYNIQLEYSTEEYIPSEQSATEIEIGIDITEYDKYERVYLLQTITHVLSQLDCVDVAQKMTDDIYYLTLFRSKETLDNHIKIIEEIIQFLEHTDSEYLGTVITIK